jgi:hypothetical protein
MKVSILAFATLLAQATTQGAYNDQSSGFRLILRSTDLTLDE